MPYSSQSGPISLNGAQTPDTYYLATNPLGNTLIIGEAADAGFDFAHPQATDPVLYIQSHNQSTTQWNSMFHNGTDGYYSTRGGMVFAVNGGVAASFINASGVVGWSSGSDVGFSSSGSPTPASGVDASFNRAAAGVIRTSTGTSTWLQQANARSYLAANYTNATTTFSNTALSITVKTGRKYMFEVVLFMADSTAADGVKIDFAGGTATATNFIVSGVLTSDTGAITALTAANSTTLAGVINAGAMATTNTHTLKLVGGFEPSANGTFIVRAAQNAHSTGTLTVSRGSYMFMEDMP